MASDIRDLSLWESGKIKIDWVKGNMPLLNSIEKKFMEERPFEGLKVTLSIHLEAKTAYLCKVLAAGGADMYVTGSNPLSTQDDVAAALVKDGLNVFAWHGCTPEEYHNHLCKVVEVGPNIIIDDGGDLVHLIHTEYPHLIPNVIGGCEETTTGIMRLLSMDKTGELKFPMMLVNNAKCKYLFDNRYGTGQSVWNGINRATNLIVAGKTVVVAGYGWCGKGVAMRAKGLGASVIVTEVDPVKAIEAVMDGFKVMTMDQASSVGDIFVTVTGCSDVIVERHFVKMKDGAICCNAGHFDCEVDVATLKGIAVESRCARENIMGYKLSSGNWVYIIAEGRLVNLASGDGHPAEIMDMSFAIQALSARYVVENFSKRAGQEMTSMTFEIPEEIDYYVARMKLDSWGYSIDVLSEEQKIYLGL